MNQRIRLLGILLAPHGVAPDEALADNEIERALRLVEEGGGYRVLTLRPLVQYVCHAPLVDEETAIARMRSDWMPFLSRRMRAASLQAQGLDDQARPPWSLLVNPLTLALAEMSGIPGARLVRSRMRAGRPEFLPLHGDAFEDMPSTSRYVRDGTHHEGADYLHGQFLMNHADHVAKHALQLLEDVRFPIRSASDANGRHTILELRNELSSTVCQALVGRRIGEVLDMPGIGLAMGAGDAVIMEAEPDEKEGRTRLSLTRSFMPAVAAPEGADMRWVGMTPGW